MATLQFYHHENSSWPEIVYEVISIGQLLGSGWYLHGCIEDDLSGVLSKSSNSKISVVGLQWAEWQITNEHQSSN